MLTNSLFVIARIFLLWSAAAYAQSFLEQPSSKTVAPNSVARFDCAVDGSDDGTEIQWKVNNKETFGEGGPTEEGYYPRWYTQFNSSLVIDTRYSNANINRTTVRCIVISSLKHHISDPAHLNIADRPLKPDGLQVYYESNDNTAKLSWNTPFTYMPEFPILDYMAEVDYLTPDRETLKTDNIHIPGAETDFAIKLNESDICMCNRLCVKLRARNQIGYSPNASTTCISIDRKHQPFPINASLAKQPSGETLVSVLYQMPPCFPQGIQAVVVVEKAPTQLPDIIGEPLVAEGDLLQATRLTKMEQDVAYIVTLNITSGAERTVSLPAYVVIPSEATKLDNGGDGGGGGDPQVVIIAVIVGVLVLSILIITALATSVAVLVYVQKKRKDTTVINGMQHNPFYENTYYDTIQDGNFTIPRNRSPSYDSHIYQDMPELVRRLQATNELPSNGPPPTLSSSSGCDMGDLEDMKRVQCTVVGVEVPIERESDYVVMQSVTESPTPLATDV